MMLKKKILDFPISARFLATLALVALSVPISAQEDDHQSVAVLRSEVEALSSQNETLLKSLRTQLEQFEKQQVLVEKLVARVEELEAKQVASPGLDRVGVVSEVPEFGSGDLTLEAELAMLEEAALTEGETGVADESNLSFGGWVGFAYTDDDRVGTKAGFDAHPLYVYAKASPAENWTFFGELEFEHLFKSSGSGTKGDLKMERLYIEHTLANGSRLRAGKFFLPYGYWYNLHWHFLTETLSRPISFNNSYVPKQQVGIEYSNMKSWGDTDASYSLWLGDGPDIAGTNKRSESDFSFGGSLFAERYLGNGVKIGGTVGYHQQKVDFDTQRNFVLGGSLSTGAWEIRGEIYRHERETAADLQSAYVSTQYHFSDTWGLVWRHDFGDDVKTSGDALDPQTTGDSIGLVWRPKPYLLFKSEYRINQFDTNNSEDFNSWNFFSALKF